MRLIPGLVLAVVLHSVLLVGQASAQCADPRGNSYGSNNEQVTVTTPGGGANTTTTMTTAPSQPAQPAQQSPAVQSNAPASANASINVDPPSAAAGTPSPSPGRGSAVDDRHGSTSRT